jgi:hypothetical protein
MQRSSRIESSAQVAGGRLKMGGDIIVGTFPILVLLFGILWNLDRIATALEKRD